MSASSTSGGGSPERALPQLRRAERDATRLVDAFLVGRVGKRLERFDVLLRSGCADELRAEALRRSGDEQDRHALDGDADCPPLAPVDDRHDLRQLFEPA